MKKIFIVIAIALIAIKSSGQQAEVSNQKVNIDYLKKSKSQRNTGLFLLGGGAVFYGLGAYQLAHATDKNGYGAFLILGGTGMAVASLPLFILSASNKHKAKVYMKREALMISPNQNSNISYNSLSLGLNL